MNSEAFVWQRYRLTVFVPLCDPSATSTTRSSVHQLGGVVILLVALSIMISA